MRFSDRENIRRAKEIKLLIKEDIEAGLILRRKDKEKALDAIEDKEGFRQKSARKARRNCACVYQN
jgi:hypothetical protein